MSGRESQELEILHAELVNRAVIRRSLPREIEMNNRERSLIRLRDVLIESEVEVLAALREDLGRDDFESFANDYGFVLKELKHAIVEFRSWAKERFVDTPPVLWPGRSQIQVQPKGVVLIMAPWNYPFNLSMSPLVAAIAAGNLVVIKPSEFAPATAAVIEKIVSKANPEGDVRVLSGDASLAERLLQLRWDHIFFTGSSGIGRKVMMAAAQFLTSVTLELGGKSPCVLGRFGQDRRSFETAVRRILVGKSVNAGQTCVAPDYLLVHRDERQAFLTLAAEILGEFHGKQPLSSPSICRIISARHFDRLVSMLGELEPGAILHGGTFDRESLKFELTLIEADLGKKIHQEEIFGPILPIVVWDDETELQRHLARHPRPLAFYVFSADRKWAKELIRVNAFGGGVAGDTLVHLGNYNLPFGGIGESGIGAYHGRFGFDAFSHQKSVMYRPYWFDLRMRYPPYSNAWKRLKGFLS